VDVDPAVADAPTRVATPLPPLAAPLDRGVVPLAATPPSAVVPAPAPVPAARHGATTEDERRRREELITIRPPLPGARILRMVVGVGMGVLAVLSLAAGVLLLLLWQQDRGSGVLSTQVERTWELVGRIQDVEVIVAYLVVPFAVAWAAVATLNVRRVTGAHRNPALVALSVAAGIALAWLAGDRVAAGAADDEAWVRLGVGIALQVLAVCIPLVALERVARATEAPRRPLRVSAVLVALCFVHLWVLDGLSRMEATVDPERWGRLGAYLVIGALLQAMAALALNEGARSIEDAAEHRFEMRRAFGATIVGAAHAR
jgi:hypothetical protein